MTNGEKIKEMFPNAEISYGLRGVVAVTFIHKTIFDLDWWNAEYKEPNKSEIITSSDCVDRHAVDMLAYRYLREPTDNHVAFYEDFLDLPPVTPIRPKGHWIKTELPSRDAHECSECGNLAIFDECRNEEMLTDFCPHCGADMRGDT